MIFKQYWCICWQLSLMHTGTVTALFAGMVTDLKNEHERMGTVAVLVCYSSLSLVYTVHHLSQLLSQVHVLNNTQLPTYTPDNSSWSWASILMYIGVFTTYQLLSPFCHEAWTPYDHKYGGKSFFFNQTASAIFLKNFHYCDVCTCINDTRCRSSWMVIFTYCGLLPWSYSYCTNWIIWICNTTQPRGLSYQIGQSLYCLT